MEKIYLHKDVESKWLKYWQTREIGRPSNQGQTYCIVVPPPNVTGTLHMGHGFQLSLMDILIRYHRMSGYNTLWQFGTDHAGIATQMVVERKLAAAGKPNKQSLGREKFNAEILDWKQQSQKIIKNQMQAMGTSMDWSRERFTLDEKYAEDVQNTFIKLYEEGLIYRGQKLVNWDPKLKTAVSDLEVINKEQNGKLWHIKYKIKNSSDFVVIATTRPETLLGDQAVAVNPEDSRYQHLIGQKLYLPLTDREIPIIADKYVDTEFGSGCVKITPAHDFNDAEIGKRHNLKALNIFTEDGHLNENVPNKYHGLERFEARKMIVKELESKNLIDKIVDHKNIVPVGDRSGAIIEPMLTNQWFLNCNAMAEQALKVVAEGEIEFIPKQWFNTYKNWLENIEDWCISRQLWWGHQIPAWYDSSGKYYVGTSEQDIKAKYNLPEQTQLIRDEDVLDTWFSSALWPFATLSDLKDTFFPTQVLVTGFDIIFFWVARMIMMSLKINAEIPFEKVYITGLIKDEKGQKMSKSKGNVLDPLDLINGISLDDLILKRTNGLMQPEMAASIEKQTRKSFPQGISAHGTDALRFTFCALANNGRDIRFDLNRLMGYRNFCNKIWNASRLVLSFEKADINYKLLSEVDKHILSMLQTCINNCHKHLKSYRFDLLAKTIYEFTWHEFCDKYLEWLKIDLKQNNESQVVNVSYHVLNMILRIMHPIMPFITEEIWQNLKEPESCLALAEYPKSDQVLAYNTKEVNDFFALVTAIRTFRSELNISPKKQIILINDNLELIAKYIPQLERMINCIFKVQNVPLHSAQVIAGSMIFSVPIHDLVEPASEISRIKQVIKKSEKMLKQAELRLSNEKYCSNAPEQQVDEYKKIMACSKQAIKNYQNHLQLMQELLGE